MENESLDRQPGIALWRQIYQRLEKDIVSGSLEPGQRLPTEADLAKRFGVNRHTLRRAMAALAEEGLIRVEQGRGTFVQEDMLDYAINRRTRFSANVTSLGRTPGGRLLHAGQEIADSHVASGMGLGAGRLVVRLELLHLVDERPLVLSSHFFPIPRFQLLPEAYERAGSITQALKACGVDDYVRKQSRISARLPSQVDAGHLAMARTQPIIVAENINTDLAGEIIEFAVSRACGQRLQYLIEPNA